jgi:hypothetical protein
VVVDEVELDLHTDVRMFHREVVIAEHPGEDVEASSHLRAVPRAILTSELAVVDVLTHAQSLGRDLGRSLFFISQRTP